MSRRGKTLHANPAGGVLVGTGDNDMMLGRAGDDRMLGNGGTDVLVGRRGNDTLFGGDGDDYLDGGKGNDILYGGHGRDQILGGSGRDFVIGGHGSDRLHGEDGDDILDGGPGNDLLDGGFGSDRYLFGWGDGRDVVINAEHRPGDRDFVQLEQGISREQVWFRREGVNLKLLLLGSNDSMTMMGWYAGAPQRVDRFELGSGRCLAADKVQLLVDAMAGFDPMTTGSALPPRELILALRPLLAENWQ